MKVQLFIVSVKYVRNTLLSVTTTLSLFGVLRIDRNC